MVKITMIFLLPVLSLLALFTVSHADQLCIAAQSGKACMIQQNSSIVCWGEWRFSMPTPQDAITDRFTHLACTDWNMFAIHKESHKLLGWGTDTNLLLSLQNPVWSENNTFPLALQDLPLEHMKCGTDLCCFKSLSFKYVYCFRTELTLSMYTSGYVNQSLPSDLTPMDSFSAFELSTFDVGPLYACGIKKEDKKIICGGYTPPDVSSIADEQITDVVCSWNNLCVQFSNSSIKCVGPNYFGEADVPDIPIHTLVGKIASSNNHCGLYGKANKLVCWGSNLNGQLRYIPSFPISQFMLSFDVMCGLTTSHIPFCYGLSIYDYNLHQIPQTSRTLQLGSLAIGELRFLLYEDGTISTLSYSPSIQMFYHTFFQLTDVREIYQHEDKLVAYLQNGTVIDSYCALFFNPCPHTLNTTCSVQYGRMGSNIALVTRCTGEVYLSLLYNEHNLNDVVNQFNALQLANLSSLSFDGNTVCYRTSQYIPDCYYLWYNYTVSGIFTMELLHNSTLFSSIQNPSQVKQIVSANCNYCVLYNGTNEVECGKMVFDVYDSCTYNTPFTLEDVPAKLFTKLFISGRGLYVCGLEVDTGYADCWGKISFLNIVPTNVGFQDLSLGETSICGLTFDNYVLCWGDNLKGEMNPVIDKRIKGGELAPTTLYKEGVNLKVCQGISTVDGSTKPQCQGLCAVGHMLDTEGQNCVLRPCLDGSIRNPGNHECMLCPAGTKQRGDSCVPCEPGFYAPNDGSIECLSCASNMYTPFQGSSRCIPCNYPYNNGTSCFVNECPVGTFANLSLILTNTTCQACELGKFSLGYQTSCVTCSANTYAYMPKSTSCMSCYGIKGIKCLDGEVEVQHGFYPLVSNEKFYALSCSYKYCKGGQYKGDSWRVCGANRQPSNDNLFCGHCLDGFSDVNGDCVPCERGNPGLIFMFIVLLWLYVVFLHLVGQSSSNSASITIFFYFIQTAFNLLSPVENYLNWLAFFNFNPQESSGSLCALPLTAYQTLAISFCLPFIFMGFLFLTFCVHWIYAHTIQSQVPFSPYKRTLINIVLFSYSQIIGCALNFLHCISLPDQGRVNYAFPAIRCDSSTYNALYAPIVFLLVFNILFVPCLILFLLKRNKHRFVEKAHVSFSMLFLPFDSKSYFWQVVILLRRVLVAVVSTFLLTQSALRAFCSTLFNMLFLLLQLWRKPFVLESDNRLEFTSLTLLVIISSIQAYSPPPTSDTMALAVSLLLVISFTTFFALFMIYKVYTKVQNKYNQSLNAIELESSG